MHSSKLFVVLIVTFFFNRTFNLEQHLTTCSERVKNVYSRNVYQILETLFDKLDSFGIKYTSQQKFSKNLAIFDFESICIQEESFKDTKDNNVDRQACTDFNIHFFEPCGRTNFSQQL